MMSPTGDNTFSLGELYSNNKIVKSFFFLSKMTSPSCEATWGGLCILLFYSPEFPQEIKYKLFKKP